MNKAILFEFTSDKENNRILVERSFDAGIDLVWAAWTEAEILDQWWAPKPWQAVTKFMNFSEGGSWLYYMQGPDGEKHWCLFDYEKIIPLQQFSGLDAFCDENGTINDSKPRVHWNHEFEANADQTIVRMQLQFDSLKDLETLIEMGFREGFTAGMENLDQYISAQFYLRKQNRTDTRARVSTYLNFAGNTDEAFYFYREVFQSEFINGITRFGDLPGDSSHPPVAENIKNMVLHVELPILGGHILMGTDAPKEMGFTLSQGNNMHIQLEPDSRAEADRIFKALSDGGVIEMPMQDMFFGAYFGSFTDKFGINWMINCSHQKQAVHEK